MNQTNGQSIPNQNGSSYTYLPSSDYNSIKFRLDTTDLLKELQILLLGEITIYDEINGEIVTRVEKIGQAKVNNIGFQSIMFLTKTSVNAMSVQGNLTDEQYSDFLADYHEALYNDLFVNSKKYGISDTDFNGIIAGLVLLVRLFTSRTISNKEREALGQSQKISENVITNPKTTKFGSRWF